MQLVEIFLLALASMIWPTLLAVVAVALASPQPVKLLSAFLAGALVTTTTVGVLVVFLLQGSSVVHVPTGRLTRPCTWPPEARRCSSRTACGAAPRGPSWSERALARGATLSCITGIVLNVIPGVFPFVALKDIVELDYSAGATVALILGFYLVMFLPAEVPLVSYIVAPANTEQKVADFRGWVSRNAPHASVVVLIAVGIYLVVRGVVSLIALASRTL